MSNIGGGLFVIGNIVIIVGHTWFHHKYTSKWASGTRGFTYTIHLATPIEGGNYRTNKTKPEQENS